MINQRPWMPSEVEKLIKFRMQELGPTAIGKELGRSRDSVRHKMRWLESQGEEKIVRVKPVKIHRTPEPVVVNPLRKKEKTHVSYSPLEWCPTCHSPVSNWGEHTIRIGCRRTA